MRKYKIRVIIMMICILSIFTMGCSKVGVEPKEESESNSILNMVQDKYHISLPQKSEDGSVIWGIICYFKDENINISFLGDAGYHKKFTKVSTEIEKDYIEYEVEFEVPKNNNDSKIEKSNGYFRIIKDENDELSLKSSWSTLNGALNLVDREECTKIIYDNFEYLEMKDVSEEFNKQFNLDIEGLKEISSNKDNENNNKEKIGSEEAQRVVRKLLNEDCWATNGTVFVNSREFYAVEETEVGADFRYLVDVYNKLEVFVQMADNMNNLIPFTESRPGTDIEGIINGEYDNSNENSNSTTQSSSFTIDDAIKILKDNGYYQSRDNQYIKDNFIMRDIETGETMSEDENGMKYYTFLIDRTATDVYENGAIKTAIDY